MATGDSGDEAYTAIAWGVGLSHERSDIAGAEGFHSLEGNMCGTAMRGADALPGSKATSRAKGSHRKLGDLGSGHRCRVGAEYDGPHREDEESKPMMHGHEKSDLAIVAGKSANNVAPRCGAIRGGVSRSGVDGAKGGGIPDAMMSLADQMDQNHATGDKISLSQRAAKLGHPRAKMALEALDQERTLPPIIFRFPY